ncbi:MAG: ATPase P [Deltaproteobacteria bacterium]|nr:MAG: ATPase P [Deltaproteobacteria bacterium]
MLNVDIPGFGPVALAYLVSDFTGTVSVGGKLLPGVKEALNRIAEFLEIHFLTADTFGAARAELEGVDCRIHILSGEAHDVQKAAYVDRLGVEKVAALGNGNNDRRMLEAAKVGIAVTEGEGCAVDAVRAADIVVNRAVDALDLLLDPRRLKATLRF